ncbi:MAG: hypothetical protein ACREXT_08870 [Gammaproteobacteria bacterium]
MSRTVFTLLPLALALAACGNDSGAPAPSADSASAPAAETAAATTPAAAPEVATESTAAPVTDEVVYDPIDVSKLESRWWQQFDTGG